MTLAHITPADRPWLRGLLAAHFGSPRIVSRGVLHEADELPGLVASWDGRPVGVLLYDLRPPECEVVALVALEEGHGIGTALLDAIKPVAGAAGCRRLWLVTTNDNLPAIAFYRRRGWTLVATHHGAVAEARRLKPEIPETGHDGIPIRDEVEFELRLTLASAGSPAPAGAYREDLAHIHGTAYAGLARDAAARLLDELARAGHRTGTVVDLGCGSGVLAAGLCEAGYHVLGIDVSDAMIALARTRAPKAEFRVGSFVSAGLPRCVAVAAIGEVLNYAFDPANDDRARAALFRRVHDALVPGGILLLDVATRDRARPGRHRSYTQGADRAVLVETDVDAAATVLTREITSYRLVGGRYRRDVEIHHLALLDTAGVLATLRATGFEARTIPGYGPAPLPPGVVVYSCRKGPRPT